MIQRPYSTMHRTLKGLAAAALATSTAWTVAPPAQAEVVVQFGGDASRIIDGDTAWENQIGADQIIQWNGVNPDTVSLPNSDPSKFGASGTLVGGTTGSSLTSLGAENLVLTTVSVNSDTTEAGFPVLGATGSPNVLGVNSGSGEDGAKFNQGALGFVESWTFEFNQPVIVRAMIGAAMDFDGERFGLDVEGVGNVADWRRTGVLVGPTGSSVEQVAFAPTAKRFVMTFPTDANAIKVEAGTDLTISGLQGNVGLHGFVVEVVPEPGSLALLSLGGLLLVGRRRHV